MIDVYSWPTSNGCKVHIALEECGLSYTLHPVNLLAGDQRQASFLALNPNGKIPVIVDNEGPDGLPMVLTESCAILIYLADKSQRLIPSAGPERQRVIEWLFWQASAVGPTLGQLHHFVEGAPEAHPYAIQRFQDETIRLYRVLDARLDATRAYVGGQAFSIADIAIWTWVRVHRRHGIDLASYPAVGTWFSKVAEREGVQRGMSILAGHLSVREPSPRLKRYQSP